MKKYSVYIPIETDIACEIEAESFDAAMDYATLNIRKLITENKENYDVFECFHPEEIWIEEIKTK